VSTQRCAHTMRCQGRAPSWGAALPRAGTRNWQGTVTAALASAGSHDLGQNHVSRAATKSVSATERSCRLRRRDDEAVRPLVNGRGRH
jgi:hypothetical protein